MKRKWLSKKTFRYCLCLVFFCISFSSIAQKDSLTERDLAPSIVKKRVRTVAIGATAFYTTLGTGLYYAWYKDYPFQKFHFFDDNNEWLQMDKVGHTFSCYAEGVNGIEIMKWTGIKKKKAILIGGLVGFGMQSIIEVFDGFSKGWGYSVSDMAANTVGSGLAISQGLLWDEQRIQMRVSYHTTAMSSLRPNLLGSNILQNFIKDYNGQTYWLSANLYSFMDPSSRFPKWLNISVGYGAYGMLTGSPGNVWTDDKGIVHDYSSYERYRQFYIAPDIDLSRLKFLQKNKLIKTVTRFVGFIKVPMPTLEINKYEVKFWGLYF